ncbi:MAG: tripartite tricarboxylate transporter substrate binding protein [Pigmentiphaga sp.]
MSLQVRAFSPDRAVRVIVPNAAGGGMDILARVICDSVSSSIGQTIIVENRPGAATSIGASAAARSAADGFTLLIASNGTLTINPLIYKQLPYNPDQDFEAVSLLAKFPMILVCGPRVTESSLSEITRAFTKDRPFTFGSPGPGSPPHLAMELFAKLSGMTVLHIPYKGAAPAVQDVASSQIDGMMVDYAAARAMLQAGRIRPIAVANQERLTQLESVPTFSELGLNDMIAAADVGIVVPSKTAQNVLNFWEREFMQAIASAEVRNKLINAGVEPVGSSRKEYMGALAQDKRILGPLLKQLDLQLD